MEYSRAQLELWIVRDKLDREVEGMTPAQLHEYFAKVTQKLKAHYGKDLEFVEDAVAHGARSD